MPILIKKFKLLYIAGVAILALFVFLIILSIVKKNVIVNNITIDGIYISGHNRHEAAELIEHKLNIIRDYYLKLYFEDKSWVFTLRDIELSFEIDKIVKNAFILDKSGGFFIRLLQNCGIKRFDADIGASFLYSHEALKSIIEAAKKDIEIVPQNATVNYKYGKITLNHELNGRSLDIDINMKLVENCISARTFVVNLEEDTIIPEITFDDIKDINSVLSSFSTTFNSMDLKRTNNIKIACERINATVIKPGEIFSTDIAIGPRTEENGYMDAPVILNNELTQGLGGGVCQVTTTLYNTVLRSKLNVIERTHHSMPLGYIAAGLDATIAENLFDFKFSNNRDSSVCLISEVNGSNIIMRVLGKKEAQPVTVLIKPIIIDEYIPDGDVIVYDSSVPPGEIVISREAKKGFKVIVYRETYDSKGKLIETEKISEDYYPPVKAMIKLNPVHKQKNG